MIPGESLRALAEEATFICGHPKSGTSLLRALLDGHPELIVFPEETRFLQKVVPRLAGLPEAERSQLAEDSLLSIFLWSRTTPHASQSGFEDRDYSRFSAAEVRQAYRRVLDELGTGDRNFLAAAMLAYGEVSHQLGERTRRWVEKTPFDENHADRIFSWWPSARCIHILRDPRDNFVSYRRKHPGLQPSTFAYSWLVSLRAARRSLKRYGGARYLMLRYEDLILEPKNSLAQIRAFLGIDEDSALHRPTRAGEPWGGNSMFGSQFEGVSREPLGRWKETLGEGDEGILTAALRKEMVTEGYEVPRHIGTFSWLGWQAYRARRRLGGVLRAPEAPSD